MGLGAHVLVVPPVGHISIVSHVPCIGSVGRLARVVLLNTARLDCGAHLTCVNCPVHHMLLVVSLRLQAVHKDHF